MPDVPCARCGELVPLRDWAADLVMTFNRQLDRTGHDRLRANEVVLCGDSTGGCYQAWQAERAEFGDRQWESFAEYKRLQRETHKRKGGPSGGLL